MGKLWAAIGAFIMAGVYSCGSSDERVNVRRNDGGQAGDDGSGNAAGAPIGGTSTPPTGTGGAPALEGGAGGVALGGAGGDSMPSSAGEAGVGGAAPVVLPEGVISNVPYSCESPFAGVAFPGYFYLEDFEDGDLSAPGVTASTYSMSSSFGGGLVDSIDCDDGAVDGTCADCDALYADGTVSFTFDAEVLGALPSHVGLVWTDGGGGASVTITGYDESDEVIYTKTVEGIGDASIYGTVEEDRFFGIVHEAGVARVQIVNSTGGVEVDHLQYGH